MYRTQAACGCYIIIIIVALRAHFTQLKWLSVCSFHAAPGH